MQKIYIVLTYTGTVLSKVIKLYKKDEFTHVSISLDIDLKEMYSFSRLRPYNPFLGGFMHEYVDRGTFKRFFKTRSIIYSLDVSDKQYKNIKKSILEMERHKNIYRFNIWGLIGVAFKKKIKRENYFYCAEFVKYIMDMAQVITDLPEIVTPKDFQNISGLHFVYKGLLREYLK